MKTHEAMLGVLGCISLFAIASAPALAQHGHKTSPYAHGQSSEVSSLTADEVRELRNGEGMGLARAAELNHFPGPKHLLELASELDLDPAQVERIEAIHKRMKGQAIAKGEEILEAESHLANPVLFGTAVRDGVEASDAASWNHARTASGDSPARAHRERWWACG